MHESLEAVKAILYGVEVFFVVYLVAYASFLFLSAVVGSSTLYRNRYYETMHNEIRSDYYIPISVIVPAYNEDVTVIATIDSLLKLDYKLYEIIVVNDGSTDDTGRLVMERFKMRRTQRPIRVKIPCKPAVSVYETLDYKVRIVLINKENGGKADALNMGINASNYPYFLGLDADSLLQRDSLEYIARPFISDDRVVAVGGLIQVANGVTFRDGMPASRVMPGNMLLAMQVLEYDRSFLASRILFDYYNGNLIISGAFGLFRKEDVITVNGYDPGTVGEDFELVIKLHTFLKMHNADYSIRYVPEAVCWTQAPSRFSSLKKQRKRWYRGLWQVLIKYREIFMNPRYGVIGYLSYLYYLVYELLAPYIEIIGLMGMITAYVYGLLNVPFMLLFLLIYMGFGALLTLTTHIARIHVKNLTITVPDFLKAALAAFLELAILRSVLNFFRLSGLFGSRKKYKWDKFKRDTLDAGV